MALARKAYILTKKFPKEETYGLSSQIKRAAVSIPSNIAEGSQRGTNKDFAHFVLTSKGSLAELETQFILAFQLEYISEEDLDFIKKEAEEIHRMIHAFHKKLITHNSKLVTHDS